MNNSETLSLIEGQFTPDEAKQILINIFLTKINFHELRNLSAIERQGKEDAFASKRIAELNNSIEKLLEILKQAESGQKKLIITSGIAISLSE